jgi:tripartite-type tricarboxylate transporter receptor subunit TctC
MTVECEARHDAWHSSRPMSGFGTTNAKGDKMPGSKTCGFVCAILLACAPAVSVAQKAAKDYPSKPIRLIVPSVAGAGIDIIAHTLGQKIARSTGQNFFVDNRGGASGSIGTDAVAKSPPDGYTILVSSSLHASLPSVMKNLPYDPVADFTPITLVAHSVGLVLVVHPSVPARSVRELIALAKAHPGKLRYGSSGVGSVTHFASESLNLMAATQITHVPYKGMSQAIVDCIAGRIEVCFLAVTAGVPYIRSGKLRALGMSASARWSELPDVGRTTRF